MPRVSGVYSLPPSYLAVSGQTIEADQHNPPLEDLANAMTQSLPRDGSAPMTGNLMMGAQRVRQMAAAQLPSDAVRLDQVTAYSAYLSSVAALPLTANRLPYATGAGTAAQTILSAYARTLLDDADATTARTTLGLGAAATRGISFDIDFTEDTADLSPRYLVKQLVDESIVAGRNGRTWQNVTSSRTHSTSYQNTTGRPIEVAIVADSTSGLRPFQVSVDNSTWLQVGGFEDVGGARLPVSVTIPSGSYYRINGAVILTSWAELR